jgi:hypothetical protein
MDRGGAIEVRRCAAPRSPTRRNRITFPARPRPRGRKADDLADCSGGDKY